MVIMMLWLSHLLTPVIPDRKHSLVNIHSGCVSKLVSIVVVCNCTLFESTWPLKNSFHIIKALGWKRVWASMSISSATKEVVCISPWQFDYVPTHSKSAMLPSSKGIDTVAFLNFFESPTNSFTYARGLSHASSCKYGCPIQLHYLVLLGSLKFLYGKGF